MPELSGKEQDWPRNHAATLSGRGDKSSWDGDEVEELGRRMEGEQIEEAST